jgi:uracil-DNA glycosylase family 4
MIDGSSVGLAIGGHTASSSPCRSPFMLIPLNLLAAKAPPTLRPQCSRCGLHQTCESPKMPPAGQGRRRILIVGEAPGRQEDRDGKPFVGDSGDLLRRLLLRCGVDMRADCVITNALICRPPRNDIDDPKKIEFCRPNVLDVIRRHDPTVIVCLGKYAVKSVIGHYYKEDTKGIMRWAGFQIPNHRPNCWICPTVHPAFVLRERDRDGCYKDRGLRERWLLKHLKAAVELSERKPWQEVPDYLSKVQVVGDTKDAARLIRRMTGSRPVSWDIETTTLKPQSPHARIVCASMSDGETTIAFPWLGEVIPAMKEFLTSSTPKISHNQRFENGWSEVHLGVKVRNWAFDTMAQAHVIDGRPGIVGLKFQAYAYLGQPDYDSAVKPYLDSRQKGGNAPNRIKMVDFKTLASYCGGDSLLTWLLADKQRKQLGVEFK